MDPIWNKPYGFYGLSMVFTMSYEYTQSNNCIDHLWWNLIYSRINTKLKCDLKILSSQIVSNLLTLFYRINQLIGFLLSSWTTYMWSLKVIGQKL